MNVSVARLKQMEAASLSFAVHRVNVAICPQRYWFYYLLIVKASVQQAAQERERES